MSSAHPKPSLAVSLKPPPCSITSPVSWPSLPAPWSAFGFSLALVFFQKPGKTQ